MKEENKDRKSTNKPKGPLKLFYVDKTSKSLDIKRKILELNCYIGKYHSCLYKPSLQLGFKDLNTVSFYLSAIVIPPESLLIVNTCTDLYAPK